MSSSVGPLALGIVGAVIGAPFGLSAVGFAVGSALGGMLFAPEGPTIEGPRIGDMDVTASTLGKILPEHYGVTRSAGNVFWSGGLKEVKKKESSGGKGGGGGSETISYHYYSSFATAFGRAPAKALLRIWADGKLIYDVTGEGDVQNDEYKFRFYHGGEDQVIDSLIEESVNRRLAGLPDVNEGNGPQAVFTTIEDMITEAQADPDPRAQLYASYLITRRDEVAGTGTPPDYRFTPAYKNFCFIVFDDIPLANFGNRIPNVTAEIAWDTADAIPDSASVLEKAITETAGDQTEPNHAVGVDPVTKRLFVKSGDLIRRFDYTALSEVDSEAHPNVTKILGVDGNSNLIVRTVDNKIAKISGGSISDFWGEEGDYDDTEVGDAAYGASIDGKSLFGVVTDTGNVAVLNSGGSSIRQVWGKSASGFFGEYDDVPNSQLIGPGPICSARQSRDSSLESFSRRPSTFILASDGTNWQLSKLSARYYRRTTGNVDNGTLQTTTYFDADLDTMATGALSGETVSNVFYDPASNRVFGLFNTGTTSGRLKKFTPDGTLVWDKVLTLAPPGTTSGLQRSDVSNGRIAYAQGTSVAIIDLATGKETILTDALSAAASNTAQIYIATRDAILTWIGGAPILVCLNRDSADAHAATLAGTISAICKRTGMQDDEFSVAEVPAELLVRGYSIARPSSGRQSLEKLLMSYFVDGIETDWAVKFRPRTTTSIRTIEEDALGMVKSPTGDVNWLESRTPEYDLPSEVALNFLDIARDYQQGSAHMRRISNPTPSMHSNKAENVEVPIVFSEQEAQDIAQRLLYLSWMSREQAKSRLSWTHLDLDPGDVFEVRFKDGRAVTDRLSKAVVGANYEVEVETVRAGDPVYEVAPSSGLSSGNVPGRSILTPAYSKMFVLDIPLLHDFHATGGVASRFYMAVGSDTTEWLNASIYESVDAQTFSLSATATVDITWGWVDTVLGPPRALWTTDHENTITVRLSVDNGDVNSATRDEIVNGSANRALIWNENSGLGEIIQFQDATVNPDGSVTLSTLTRGLRGTDYAVGMHDVGELFLLLKDSAMIPDVAPLAAVGGIGYFRAVSQGSLLNSAQIVDHAFVGRDLMPWAPSRVRRSDDGTDLTVTWNRRTRIGGEWNMVTNVETVPLNEDSEQYEFYVLPNTPTALDDFNMLDATTYLEKQVLTAPAATVTGANLTLYGYTLADRVNVAVRQMSAQVGGGFMTKLSLAP